MVIEAEKDNLLKEIKELEAEIEEMKQSIPPHSARYELVQLLEEKEGELERKRERLRNINIRAGEVF